MGTRRQSNRSKRSTKKRKINEKRKNIKEMEEKYVGLIRELVEELPVEVEDKKIVRASKLVRAVKRMSTMTLEYKNSKTGKIVPINLLVPRSKSQCHQPVSRSKSHQPVSNSDKHEFKRS